MPNKPHLDEYKQQLADFYNNRTDYDSSELAYRRAIPLVELATLQRGQKILDVATGTGIVAIAAAEIVGNEGKVIGIDIASVLLNQAQQKIEAAGLKNIELVEADVEYLSFNENSFDAIFCSSAIVLFTDIPAILHKWYHWLKPGGIVAFHAWAETSFMTPAIIKACAKYGVSLPNIHEPLGTPQRCQKLLQRAGFENIEVKIEQLGKYLSVDDAKNWWGGGWLHPKNPLLELSTEKMEKIKAEYANQVEVFATEEGVLLDITTFFILARK